MANTKITTNVIADDAVTSDKLGGDLTMPGHVSLADNKELRIGTGNDLVIKHDATDTIFTNTTGNLVLAGSHVYIANAAVSEYMGLFIADGAASLRFNNVEELATVSGGVYIPNELGIGTNSPTQKLEILGSSSTLDIGADDTAEVVAQFVPNSSNNRNGQLRIAGTTSPHNHSIALISDASTNVGMSFVTTASGTRGERMVIGSTGDVGIGTTAPIMKMHVKGATGDVPSNDSNPPANGIAIFDSGGGYSLVIGTDDSNTGSAWIQSQSANVSSSEYDLLLNPNGGSVGIGTTTNPAGLPLHLKVSSGDNKLRMQTANKDAFVMELRDASGDLWLGTNTTAGAIQIGDAGQVNMPSQPVASYGHSAGSEAGGYAYNFGGTGSVSVICKPQAAIINRGSMYNSSTGRFTAPKAGIYRYAVHGNLYTLYLADGAYFMIQIRKNGGHYVYHYEVNEANSSSWLYNNMGGVISMAKDDYLEFRLVSNNMSGGASGGFGWDASSYTHYEFHLLY